MEHKATAVVLYCRACGMASIGSCRASMAFCRASIGGVPARPRQLRQFEVLAPPGGLELGPASQPRGGGEVWRGRKGQPRYMEDFELNFQSNIIRWSIYRRQ